MLTRHHPAAPPLQATPSRPLVGPWLIRGFHVSAEGRTLSQNGARCRRSGIEMLLDRYQYLKSRVPDRPVGALHFLGSPRRSEAFKVSLQEARAFQQHVDPQDLRLWTLHAKHTTNLASREEGSGFESIRAEMMTCKRMGIPTLCVHLGSALDDSESQIVDRLANRLTRLLTTVPDVNIAMENMPRRSVGDSCSGQPWKIKTLHRIMQRVTAMVSPSVSKRLKICVDICHAHIAEYDLATNDGAEAHMLLADLDAIGFDRVAGFHVSDSSVQHGQSCEGHTNVGAGLISLHAFKTILGHRNVLGAIPCYLESPAYAPKVRPSDDLQLHELEMDLHIEELRFLEEMARSPASSQVYDELWQTHWTLRNRLRSRIACRLGSRVSSTARIAHLAARNKMANRVRSAKGKMIAQMRSQPRKSPYHTPANHALSEAAVLTGGQLRGRTRAVTRDIAIQQHQSSP